MFYNLAKRNLQSQKGRTVLTITGISIGIASLMLMISLSNGIKYEIVKNVTNKGPLTQITVQPKAEKGNFLKLLAPGTSQKITPALISRIESIPHIKQIYPEMNYESFSSLQVKIWDQSFQTDTMIFGVPLEYIREDLLDTNKSENLRDWYYPAEPYPAIVSRKIIDLYNFTVAPTNNLPKFTEEDLVGTELTLLPDYSTFFPQLNENQKKIRVKVVGFSDKVDLVGITMPLKIVKELNKEKKPDYKENYLKLFINVDSAENINRVSSQIEEYGLTTFSSKEEVNIIESNFKIITLGLTIISLIILLVSGLTIANTFMATVLERKHEIGLLRTLGATKKDIKKIFLSEAGLIGFWGGLTGIIIGAVSSKILDHYALKAMPDITMKPETLFKVDLHILIGIWIFAMILSVVFAYLPASKAARLKPLEALT